MNPALKKLLFQSDLLVRLRNRIGFYKVHKRLPKKTDMSFNDHFFQVKDTIANDALRIYVSDKEFVKTFIADIVGDQYNIPTIAILHDTESATAFFKQNLGRRFVVKPTNMSGECIIADGILTPEQVKKALGWFNENYFYRTGEQNYRNLESKLIVEEFLDFDGEQAPKDYKCFCSKGKLVMFMIISDRFTNHNRGLYSRDWDYLPFTIQGKEGPAIDKPIMLPEIIRVAEALSQKFDLIRVDLYVSDKKVMVGELTNVHEDASGVFSPVEADQLVGKIFTNPNLKITDLLSQL